MCVCINVLNNEWSNECAVPLSSMFLHLLSNIIYKYTRMQTHRKEHSYTNTVRNRCFCVPRDKSSRAIHCRSSDTHSHTNERTNEHITHAHVHLSNECIACTANLPATFVHFQRVARSHLLGSQNGNGIDIIIIAFRSICLSPSLAYGRIKMPLCVYRSYMTHYHPRKTTQTVHSIMFR